MNSLANGIRPLRCLILSVFIFAGAMTLAVRTGNPTFAVSEILVVAAASWTFQLSGGVIAILLVNTTHMALYHYAMPSGSPHHIIAMMPFGTTPTVIIDIIITIVMSRFRTTQDALDAAKMALNTGDRDVEEVLREMHELRGQLPVCSGCRKVRNEEGGWERPEDFLSHHTCLQVKHSICPECKAEASRLSEIGHPADISRRIYRFHGELAERLRSGEGQSDLEAKKRAS